MKETKREMFCSGPTLGRQGKCGLSEKDPEIKERKEVSHSNIWDKRIPGKSKGLEM